MIGFDYTARIAPVALRAADCSVVVRYFTRPDWAKSITRGELAELVRAGMPVVVNFESTADRMLGGATAGRADALELVGYLTAFGIPAAAVVGWYSADWDVQPAQVAAVLAYLGAAAAVHGSRGLVGCYGGLRVVAAAADAGYRIWQTLAWSGGRWDPRAVMRQTGQQQTVGGVSVDVNQIMNLSALGAWTSGGTSMANVTIDHAAIAAQFADLPDLPAKFAGATADSDVAALWGDIRSAAAAEYARQARDAVNALSAKVGAPAPQPVDVVGLAAALGPLLHPTTDVDAFVTALLPHLPGAPDPAAFIQALLTHVKVV